MRGDFDEDEYENDDEWQCFEDTCVCTDGMCGESEAMNQEDCGHQDVECWVRQLRAAGWTAVIQRHRPARLEATDQVTTTWRSPAGSLYRGPFRAWQIMKYHECVRTHSRTCTCGAEAIR